MSKKHSALKAKYKNNSVVSVKSMPILSFNFNGFLACGVKGSSRLTVGEGIEEGEIVIVNGVQFTAVIDATLAVNEFVIGINTRKTAQNLAYAILNNPNPSLQAYNVTVANDIVTLTQNTASGIIINVIGSANISVAVSVAGTNSGIDVSGIKCMESFIGAIPTANFSLVMQVTGLMAKDIAATNGSPVTYSACHAGDSVAVYSINVKGTIFQGALFQANGSNLNSAQLKMIDNITGQYFTINGDLAYNGDISTFINAICITHQLNDLWHGTTFQQTRALDINTDAGDILNYKGLVIGSVTGMVVKLTTDNFDNLSFASFTIAPSIVNSGGVKFTAAIELNNIKVGQLIDALSIFPKGLTSLIIEYLNDLIICVLDDTEANIHNYVKVIGLI